MIKRIKRLVLNGKEVEMFDPKRKGKAIKTEARPPSPAQQRGDVRELWGDGKAAVVAKAHLGNNDRVAMTEYEMEGPKLRRMGA